MKTSLYWSKALCLSLSVTSLSACHLLLGLEEAELSDRDPTNHTGGTGGTGGSNGTGGTGGTGGSGGTIGDIAIPAPDSCAAADLFLNQELIRSCLYRVSCDPLIPSFAVSECVSFDVLGSLPNERCSQGAQSCLDITECIHRTWLSQGVAEQICSATSSEWACYEGSVAVRCGSALPYAIDCSAWGALCSPHDSLTSPHVWGCAPPAAPTCTAAQEGSWFCSGTELYTCLGGAAQGYDCASQNLDCFAPEPGIAYCADTDAVCSLPETASCSGSTAQLCSYDYLRTDYNCATSELSCEVEDGHIAHCLAPGCGIEDACTETCVDSETLQFCVGNSPVHVNCTKLGFSSCMTEEGTSRGNYARCVD